MRMDDKKEYRKLSELQEWDKNPRALKRDGYERLKYQVQKLGQYKPLLVSRDGFVLGGNQRLKVFADLGFRDVWVSIVDAPDDKSKLEYALSDNDRVGYYVRENLMELVSGVEGLDIEQFSVDMGEPMSLDWIAKIDLSPETDTQPDEPKNFRIVYEIVFDSEDQRREWDGFIKTIRQDGLTIAQSIMEYIRDHAQG